MRVYRLTTLELGKPCTSKICTNGSNICSSAFFHNDNEWKWWSEGLPQANLFRTTFFTAQKNTLMQDR